MLNLKNKNRKHTFLTIINRFLLEQILSVAPGSRGGQGTGEHLKDKKG
jgi:hypothetical protein